MIIAKHTNEPVSRVREMSTEDFVSFARIALMHEMAQTDMTDAEKAEMFEDTVFGTDYSSRRDLRNLARKVKKMGGMK